MAHSLKKLGGCSHCLDQGGEEIIRWLATYKGITAFKFFFPIEHMKFKEFSAKLTGWLDVFVFQIVFTLILKLFCLFFWMTKGSYTYINIG